MEILDSLFARVTGTRAEWLRQVREEAPSMKAQEEEASKARLADMWAAERRRREALAQSRAERDRQQRIIIAVTAAIIVLVIIVILIVLAIMTSSPPGSYPAY
jgi:t-SNARE complex subunit (syntaxin)